MIFFFSFFRMMQKQLRKNLMDRWSMLLFFLYMLWHNIMHTGKGFSSCLNEIAHSTCVMICTFNKQIYGARLVESYKTLQHMVAISARLDEAPHSHPLRKKLVEAKAKQKSNNNRGLSAAIKQ